MPQWTPAFGLSELPAGGARLFKHGPHRIAVFHAEGGVYAVDNACPHEGYPLAQGKVSGCVLTCIWHSFRFDLRDGRCLQGDEAVRSWPVRVVDGVVQLDLAEPDPGPRIAARWHSLEDAVLQRRVGQAIRDAGRLLQDGVAPERILARLAALDGRHMEYGSSHGLALAAEGLRLLPRGGDLAALTPIAQVIDLVSEAIVRRPARPHAPLEAPPARPADLEALLRAVVEADDAPRAEALVRGAVAAGWRRAELEGAFYALCADHFLEFGHCLIYTTRAFDLLDAVDWEGAGDVLAGLVVNIALGTREDLLPEWAAWRKRMLEIEPELERLYDARVRGVTASWDALGWVGLVLDGRPGEALAAAVEGLRRGVPPVDLVDGLSLAASERILRFDTAHDRDVGVQHGWLDVTHLLTFTAAVRAALERWEDPRALRLLLQAVHFVRKHKPLDRPGRVTVRAQGGSAAEVLAAVDSRDAERAVGLAAGLDLGELVALEAPLLQRAMGDQATRPILVAHRIKLTLAGFDELRALRGDTRARQPVLAALAFLASPAQERRVGRLVHEARQLLEQGQPPRTLC